MVQIKQILGKTYCIFTGTMCIPFYRLPENKIVLMDSGLPEEGDAIEWALNAAGLQVRAILTSHAHYDHIGNHSRLQAKYGAEIYQSLFDAAITQTPLTLQACFYTSTPGEILSQYPYMLIRPDRLILPRDTTVQIDGAAFQILRLPGHAHDHIGFVTPDGAAYLGDLLLGENTLDRLTLLFGQCWQEALHNIDSIHTKQYPVFILAHNDVYTDIRGVAEKNRAAIEAQIERFLSLMEHWVTREDLTVLACRFGRHLDTPNGIQLLDRIVNSVLVYLRDTGRLEQRVCNQRLYYQEKGPTLEEGGRHAYSTTHWLL